MKKIDFHIHTISTESDNSFNFDMDILAKYVNDLSIDAIAITNHNIFNKNQYDEIVKTLKTSTVVFPGIEVSLENGHILVIAPTEKIYEFDNECHSISNHFKTHGLLSINDFLEIFENIYDYLIIPHYDKKPVISDSIIEKLREHIVCGEVQSPKKFEYCIKDETKLTPVLFSDFRQYNYNPDPKNQKTFPVRQTYIDCNNLALTNLKLALRDKHKVSLTPTKLNKVFQILPDGTIASTGINVIVGKRSSGKTYTLDMIRNTYDINTVKYIKQFSLVSGSDENRFNDTLKTEKSDFSDDYLRELKELVSKVSKIDVQSDRTCVGDYITSLIAFAKNQDKMDAYSRIKLFSETLLSKETLTGLQSLIKSVFNILDNTNYKTIIEKHLSIENLKKLFLELNQIYERKKLANKIVEKSNIIINEIKNQLGKKTAVPQPTDCDMISYAKDYLIVNEFNKLIDSMTTKKTIFKETRFGSYEIIGTCFKIKNVSELKKNIKVKISSDDFKKCSNPYSLLCFLLNNDAISKEEAYKIFWEIEYTIVNCYGKSLSGGEKAEYNLLTQLKNSQKYDMILIDELESSFDNVFLKSNVIQMIKDLSIKSTVFIVTHNNTLGVLIQPDRLLYTEKTITPHGVEYKIYSGKYDAKELQTVNGEKKQNYIALLDTMEAGEEAYNDRRRIYENIKNI